MKNDEEKHHKMTKKKTELSIKKTYNHVIMMNKRSVKIWNM